MCQLLGEFELAYVTETVKWKLKTTSILPSFDLENSKECLIGTFF